MNSFFFFFLSELIVNRILIVFLNKIVYYYFNNNNNNNNNNLSCLLNLISYKLNAFPSFWANYSVTHLLKQKKFCFTLDLYNKVEETTHKYFRLWRPLNTSKGSAFSTFSCKYLQKETFTYKQTLVIVKNYQKTLKHFCLIPPNMAYAP